VDTQAVVVTAIVIGLMVGLAAEAIERCRSKARTRDARK
jgi:multisubunit Na+/H+ antiporter MnhC subunit